MKSTVIRFLSAALSLLCLLSFTACGGGDDNAETTNTPPPLSGVLAEGHRDIITDFVTENQAVLEGVVDFLSDEDGLSYYYFTDAGTSISKVEQLIVEDGTYTRQASNVKALQKLAELRFTGEVTHNADAEVDYYSFYTNLHKGSRGFYFVYCAAPNATDYLSNNFFHRPNEVIVAPIAANWYYVECN